MKKMGMETTYIKFVRKNRGYSKEFRRSEKIDF